MATVPLNSPTPPTGPGGGMPSGMPPPQTPVSGPSKALLWWIGGILVALIVLALVVLWLRQYRSVGVPPPEDTGMIPEDLGTEEPPVGGTPPVTAPPAAPAATPTPASVSEIEQGFSQIQLPDLGGDLRTLEQDARQVP